VRCLVGAECQGRERRQCVRGSDDEVRPGRVVGPVRAGVERQPGGGLGVGGERAAEPDDGVLVEQGQGDGGEARAERGRRVRWPW
jgi:hypothetical protein